MAQSTVHPPMAQPTVHPPMAQSTVHPPAAQSTVRPPMAQPTVHPPMAQPTVHPPMAQSTVHPSVGRSPSCIPQWPQSTVHPSNVHRASFCWSQSTVHPTNLSLPCILPPAAFQRTSFRWPSPPCFFPLASVHRASFQWPQSTPGCSQARTMVVCVPWYSHPRSMMQSPSSLGAVSIVLSCSLPVPPCSHPHATMQPPSGHGSYMSPAPHPSLFHWAVILGHGSHGGPMVQSSLSRGAVTHIHRAVSHISPCGRASYMVQSHGVSLGAVRAWECTAWVHLMHSSSQFQDGGVVPGRGPVDGGLPPLPSPLALLSPIWPLLPALASLYLSFSLSCPFPGLFSRPSHPSTFPSRSPVLFLASPLGPRIPLSFLLALLPPSWPLLSALASLYLSFHSVCACARAGG